MAKDDSGTWNDHAKMKTCTTCGGEGELKIKVAGAGGQTVEKTEPCKPCNGTGRG